ncbi:sugar ABC transporter ATP-binding protein [Bacillus sp. sid0103]|uniref:sugar ABC transporter ATP-binding protein n=1 Tax=Bacillus sp. sid0103 TaxID=2856337 RepID=UPI001C45B2B7|nr:sugar ABC transporter ATP-binding protein [Bacillus sp. sid0103]MBV7508426.1 sugar ABC transporter ATP-binding protein [Bacillus sp. sid0103]
MMPFYKAIIYSFTAIFLIIFFITSYKLLDINKYCLVGGYMLLELKNIHKSFFGTKVLDGIDFELKSGEVHAIIGENGAGKSTLIKIIAGIYTPYEGEIYIDDEKVKISSTNEAQKLGVSTIYQEPMLVRSMSIAENIFLGNYPKLLGFIPNFLKMKNEAKRLLELLGCPMNPNALVSSIDPGERNIVSIARALSKQSKILIMDETTANLNEVERNRLYKLIKEFKKQGIGIIFISHQLDEVIKISDRVTILRDGRHISTNDIKTVNKREIVKQMIGKDIHHYFPPIFDHNGEEMLRVENLSRLPLLKNINLSLYEGEILGIAGLSRSGRTELSKIIIGQVTKDSGNVFWRGKEIELEHPYEAVGERIGYVSENRLEEGLLTNMDISQNLTISSLDKFNKWQFIRLNDERDTALEKVMELDIKLKHIHDQIKYLSGGNQQKVILGKWLVADSELFLLNEPTRGIDIGSRCELYLAIHELAQKGKGVMVISSDISELIGLCHRILVLRDGQIVDEIHHSQASEERIRRVAIQ